MVMAVWSLELNLGRLLCRCRVMTAEKQDGGVASGEVPGSLGDLLQALKAQQTSL